MYDDEDDDKDDDEDGVSMCESFSLHPLSQLSPSYTFTHIHIKHKLTQLYSNNCNNYIIIVIIILTIHASYIF